MAPASKLDTPSVKTTLGWGFYAIYAPAHHKPGKVHATAAAATADKNDAPAAWSEQGKQVPDKHE